MLKKITFLSLTFFITTCLSQNIQLSTFSEVSIITSAPGDNLYEKFGHTAIRIKDPVLNMDNIYNYGFFDFDAPNFYVNFTKGFMKYKLIRYPFYYALKDANSNGRWVKQQVLNLNQQEKNDFFMFLEHNAKPENASYLYDPYFNNCATKPRDIIKEILKDKLVINDPIVKKESLRQLMNKEIHPNTWGSLGINIALGSRLDQIATIEEYMYLPDYVYTILNAATLKRGNTIINLVKKDETLLDFEERIPKGDSFSPFLIFSILAVLVFYITFKDFKHHKRSRWLDTLLFSITGLTGVLVLFLWGFTNHSTAPNNFNFLWAFAPNIIAAFLHQNTKLKWRKHYLLLLLILLAFTPCIWLLKIQLYALPIIPILLLLAVRYLYIYYFIKNFE